jgi:8-oxo-dGTP diphosphatase
MWPGDDRDRPLSKVGARQAGAIASELRDLGIERIVSSPYLRCVDTVRPLGDLLGVKVETTEALAEGSDPKVALACFLDLIPYNGVACTHGDLVPALLRALRKDGMTTDGALHAHKGAAWIMETKRSKVRRAVYFRPHPRAD